MFGNGICHDLQPRWTSDFRVSDRPCASLDCLECRADRGVISVKRRVLVGIRAVAFLVWSVIFLRFEMKKMLVLVATLATLSSSAMAYTERDVDLMLDTLVQGQVEYARMLAKGYGLSQKLVDAVIEEDTKNLNSRRVAERLLREVEGNPGAAMEEIPLRLAVKGYCRLPPEDVVFVTEFQTKMIASLPDEACKAMSIGSKDLIAKPDPDVAKFFASQNSADVIRFLCMHTKAIKAEVDQIRKPVKITPLELTALQQTFRENYQRIFSEYSVQDQQRMAYAQRNPLNAPACDVCNGFKMSFRVFESLNPEMKTLFSYNAMTNMNRNM